jgi:hypothetical protein
MVQARVFDLFHKNTSVSHFLARDDQLFPSPKTLFGRIRTQREKSGKACSRKLLGNKSPGLKSKTTGIHDAIGIQMGLDGPKNRHLFSSQMPLHPGRHHSSHPVVVAQ